MVALYILSIGIAWLVHRSNAGRQSRKIDETTRTTWGRAPRPPTSVARQSGCSSTDRVVCVPPANAQSFNAARALQYTAKS